MRFHIPSQDHLSRVVATRYGRAECGICIKIASKPNFDSGPPGQSVPARARTGRPDEPGQDDEESELSDAGITLSNHSTSGGQALILVDRP